MPPVTAERSPPASRITGADSPVIADSSTEPTPSMISPSAGMTSPASTTTTSPRWSSGAGTSSSAPLVGAPVRDRRRARRAQRVRLRLAAALGDRLGEVREQHGQPEPDRDRRRRTRAAPCSPRARSRKKIAGRDHAAELDDEHHRVPELAAAGRASGTSRGSPRRRCRARRCLPTCGPLRALLLVECEVELEHVDAGLAEEAERAAVGVLSRSAAAPSRAAGAATAATRRACSCA